ncbi:ankyrin repeat-containing domain protein [Gorgonomyces haynaldii]|nr:ankyrin repeat-containing domain protein [Gorgonomyces haynaldii]
MSLLQLAALCGHLEMCELLLDLGADINQTPVGFKGLTPLYFAIYSKNCHLCRYLLEKGAVLQQTRMQPSCVAIALAHGSVETVQMFMEHGMMLKEDEIQNELKSVMKYGTLASVQWMLEHPVAMQCYQECPDYCIQVVRDENTIDVVVYLINKAVFQSYRQAWLTSCMMKATFLDLVQDMKLLLDNGVFLNGYPNAPHSPLCRASFYNAIGVVKLLLDSGASMHIGNPRKICPLIHAVAMNHPGVCKILIERDPKVVQWACRDGFYGALHIATHAVDEDLSLMRLLLESGANVDARDTIGVTPLMIAAIFKNITKCQFLLEHGADIHRTDDYKRSVYSWALESKDQSTIAFVSDKLRLKA